MTDARIFFDANSTTPVDKRVIEAMLPYYSENYGNPASIDHTFGTQANNAIKQARKRIANAINAAPEDIIFTSGATEADNLVIQGILQANKDKGSHLITCATEHPAVLEPAKALEAQGFEVTYLPVDNYGLVDLDMLINSIKPETVLVSIMAANNEIGTIAPLREIGAITKSKGIYFHTDAAQAVGHIPIDVKEMNIDCMSISGHKMHGPKGIGALYIRRSNPRVKIIPSAYGGGHERGLRPGTLNVPGIVGLAKAVEISQKEMAAEHKRCNEWRNMLLQRLNSECGEVELNGHPEHRIAHNLNLFIEGVENKALMNRLQDFALSAGSACSTVKAEESHVIKALGLGNRRSFNSIRIGFCRTNTQPQVELLADRLVEEITAIRRIFG